MNPQTTRARRRPWWRLRRPSLTTGLLLGIVTYAALWLLAALGWRARFIVAWDIGAGFALAIMYVRLRRSPATTMKRIAMEQDVGKWWVLILSLAAASASLVVITAEMPVVKEATGWGQAGGVMLVVCTVALSWGFIQTIFALHYAHDYYMAVDLDGARPRSDSKRLVFPGEKTPTYGDFLYFSFTIGMTFQVSDVQITDPAMRRLVLAHGIVGFFYATGIVALAINLVAGLI